MRDEHVHGEVDHLGVQSEVPGNALVKHNIPATRIFLGLSRIVTDSVPPKMARLPNFISEGLMIRVFLNSMRI